MNEPRRLGDILAPILTEAKNRTQHTTQGDEIMTPTTAQTEPKNFADCADTDIVDQLDLAGYFGCTDRTIRSMVARGELPPPLRLGGKSRWIAGNIRTWLADRARRQEEAARKYFQRIESIA